MHSEIPRVIPELLRRSARLVPQRPAVVVAGGPTLTFAECEARSNAFARGLRDRGVRRGDRVALLHRNADWSDFVVAYFGALKAGAATLLLGNRIADPELGDMLARYRVVGTVRPGHTGPATTGWVADNGTLEAGRSTGELPVAATPDGIADVIFTSGTTALPRGVQATHANVLGAQATWPTGPRANQPCLHALPIGSVAAQVTLINCVGGQHTMVVLPEFGPATFHRLAAEHNVVSACLVPAMGHALVRAGVEPPLDSVIGVSFSGAALPVGIMSELPAVFPRATFFNFYTSTEAFPARVATRFDPARPTSVGRPVGGCAVRVTAPDGTGLGSDEVGEVWLRSGGAPTRRFIDDRAAGSETFRDGWTRTGDLGYLDRDGYLFLAGRTTDIVNVGGFNVSTFRVEEVLGRHHAVAEAAVFPVDHPVLGEVVAAFVVPRDPAAGTTARELRQHAAGQLSRHELPAVVRLVDELPRNEAGKVLKRELPALLDAAGPTSFVAPRNERERAIARIWAEALDVGSVGVEDNFFDLGGDSLIATEIVTMMRARLGAEADVLSIFERPTVAEQVEHGPRSVPEGML